jgi:hypothetical protein
MEEAFIKEAFLEEEVMVVSIDRMHSGMLPKGGKQELPVWHQAGVVVLERRFFGKLFCFILHGIYG